MGGALKNDRIRGEATEFRTGWVLTLVKDCQSGISVEYPHDGQRNEERVCGHMDIWLEADAIQELAEVYAEAYGPLHHRRQVIETSFNDSDLRQATTHLAMELANVKFKR